MATQLPYLEALTRHIAVEAKRMTPEQLVVIRLLWKNWGVPMSQKQIAESEPWLGCHPTHEVSIVPDEMETSKRMVREIIRNLRVDYHIPIIASRAGYHLPKTKQEVKAYCDELKVSAEARARAAMETYHSVLKALGIDENEISV